MDLIILILSIFVFLYSTIVHHIESNSPEEYPSRMIMLLTFLFVIVNFSKCIGLYTIISNSYLIEILLFFVLFRITYFLNNRC